jgi:transposase
VRNGLVFRKAPYSSAKPQLMPASVEELIPKDDPVRGYKVMLGALGFQALLDTYCPFGGVSYDPRMLAAVWLFASTDGVHTSRELEKRCRFDVRYLYLTGGQCPGHTTLSRFRVRLMSVGQEFFAETNQLAQGLGLGISGTATIDGRKTAGALDQWTRLRKDATEKELAFVSDGEARTLYCTRSGYVNGYSCMVGVDAQDDVIVGACVSQESSDNKSLPQTLEAIEVQSGALPPKVVMDEPPRRDDFAAVAFFPRMLRVVSTAGTYLRSERNDSGGGLFFPRMLRRVSTAGTYLRSERNDSGGGLFFPLAQEPLARPETDLPDWAVHPLSVERVVRAADGKQDALRSTRTRPEGLGLGDAFGPLPRRPRTARISKRLHREIVRTALLPPEIQTLHHARPCRGQHPTADPVRSAQPAGARRPNVPGARKPRDRRHQQAASALFFRRLQRSWPATQPPQAALSPSETSLVDGTDYTLNLTT